MDSAKPVVHRFGLSKILLSVHHAFMAPALEGEFPFCKAKEVTLVSLVPFEKHLPAKHVTPLDTH
jgi:hypothetical protein